MTQIIIKDNVVNDVWDKILATFVFKDTTVFSYYSIHLYLNEMLILFGIGHGNLFELHPKAQGKDIATQYSMPSV